MIQFFINNIEIILPEETDVPTVEENPLITRNGEFSMDITTSLLEGKNAKAFKHINRLNQSTVQMEGDARMIIDGKQKKGTYTVLSVTDISVTWQFLAGNSELNYLAGLDSKKIWEYDWGSEAEINYNLALRSINYPGYGIKRTNRPPATWTQKYVCAPLLIGNSNPVIVNDFIYINPAGDGDPDKFVINGINGEIIIQPYLLYYINKLPEILGYTMGTNILNDDSRAQYMYLVNTVNSLNYADMLPDMTVTEFIDAIESFFGVYFHADSRTKKVDILNVYDNLITRPVVKLNAIDNYSRKFENSKSTRFDYTQFDYETPDNIQYKYLRIADDIISKCEIKEFTDYDSLIGFVLHQDFRDKFIIYRDNDKNNDYIFANPTPVLYNRYAGAFGDLMLVNKLKPTSTDNSSSFKLKLYPASVVYKSLIPKNGSNDYYYVDRQIAQTSNEYFVKKTIGLVKTIEESEQNIPRLSGIEIALFQGKIKPVRNMQTQFTPQAKYPMSTIDIYPEFGSSDYSYFQEWIEDEFQTVATQTMRLAQVSEDYNYDKIIDTSQLFEFTFKETPEVTVNVNCMFENQTYTPVRFEKMNKSNTLVTGYFYRMNS